MERAKQIVNEYIENNDFDIVLDLSNLNLTELPNNIPVDIRKLNCFFNRLTELPSKYTKLVELKCDYNGLKRLPVEYTNLTWLDCGHTPLTELPIEYTNLTWLDCNRSMFCLLYTSPSPRDRG